MRIQLIAVGRKAPSWVAEGFREYARRLPRECALELTEIAAGRRRKGVDVAALVAQEGERMLRAVPAGALLIALDEGGEECSTRQLAGHLAAWQMAGQPVALLVGGPDGLAPSCLARASLVWSLSRLTLPHPLVRVVVAEQLYRAWSLNANHPYHRG